MGLDQAAFAQMMEEGLCSLQEHFVWIMVAGPVAAATWLLWSDSQMQDPMAVMTSSSSVPLPRKNGPLDILARAEARRALQNLARQRGITVKELRRRACEVPLGEEHVKDANGNPAVIETWDWVAEWDERRCLSPHELQTWRQQSDPLVDNALNALYALESKPGARPSVGLSKMEVLERLVAATSDSNEQSSPEVLAINTFLESISLRPPRGVGILGEDWYAARESKWHTRWAQAGGVGHISTAIEALQSSKREEQSSKQMSLLQEALTEELQAERLALADAQRVFYTYFGPILLSLLHFSLAGGFSSPRITNVLRQTGYLVPGASKAAVSEAVQSSSQQHASSDTEQPPAGHVAAQAISQASADRTWQRLMETTQFVADVMETVSSLTPPTAGECPATSGGAGWQSSVRVRLLHGSVRSRILRTLTSTSYSVEQDGIPINQEDMAATLASFCSAPLWSLSRMGISLTVQERDAVVSLWRHVGFYMGVEPQILKRCFKDAESADGLLFSTVRHLFGSEEILKPAVGSPDQNAEVRQALSGPTIPVLTACADRPPFFTPLEVHFALARHLLGNKLSTALGVPPMSKKRRVLIEFSFLTMHLPVTFGRLYPRKGWEAERLRLARPLLRRVIVFSLGFRKTRFAYGGLPAGRPHDEAAEEGEKVERDLKMIKQIIRGWRLLIVEAVVVSAVVAAATGGVMWFGIKAMMQAIDS